jgi:hypothetical protein
MHGLMREGWREPVLYSTHFLGTGVGPNLDDGGPLRLLGALYLKAPAWPNGVGDRDKALELLEKAVKEHPGHPLNHLFYAQALWDEDDETKLTQVKAEFTLGEKLLDEGNWGYSKASWKKEFDDFQQELTNAEPENPIGGVPK